MDAARRLGAQGSLQQPPAAARAACQGGGAMKMAGTKWTRRLAGTVVVLVLAAAVSLGLVALDRAGDGAAGDDRGRLVRPRGNSSLAQARAFEGYPLYSAGSSALGHRLEAVLRLDRTSPARYVEFTFLYGACRARGDQGCGAPLVILLWPACYRYERRYSISPRERTVVRGVPGRYTRESRRLELYPAETTIVIQGPAVTSRADLLEVARRLRGVNVAHGVAEPLRARPPHAGRTLRCR